MVEKEPKYHIRWTNQYKKDVKLAKKRNYNISELLEVVKKLSFGLPFISIQKIYHILWIKHIVIVPVNKSGQKYALKSMRITH